MKTKCCIRISRADFDELRSHLFPGDHDEHGAILLAGYSRHNGEFTLHVREVHKATEGVDYVQGKIGYRALSPQFIHRLITRARDERLAYLAVHNHGSDREVGFSQIDLESHERGYPALLQISRGMPVGGLVFGQRSMEADLWLPSGERHTLEEAVIVGSTIQTLTPSPKHNNGNHNAVYDRQLKMFGKVGQSRLAQCKVGVLGLGGIGSIVSEYLARLGVGNFYVVDTDAVEESNLSRIVGATGSDARRHVAKTKVARRVILQANKGAHVEVIRGDVAQESVAKKLTRCDYLFLAADSMRARLVFNALIHQYLIPGVQLGSKVRAGAEGTLIDVFSANRPVRPGRGCLWCSHLIDSNTLAQESKTDEERKEQAYGVQETNPSVISLNAISAAHAVTDFLLDYLALRAEPETLHYEQFHLLERKRDLVLPRNDPHCSECSKIGLRYGRGDTVALPCLEG